jgi:hypothetical protein
MHPPVYPTLCSVQASNVDATAFKNALCTGMVSLMREMMFPCTPGVDRVINDVGAEFRLDKEQLLATIAAMSLIHKSKKVEDTKLLAGWVS